MVRNFRVLLPICLSGAMLLVSCSQKGITSESQVMAPSAAEPVQMAEVPKATELEQKATQVPSKKMKIRKSAKARATANTPTAPVPTVPEVTQPVPPMTAVEPPPPSVAPPVQADASSSGQFFTKNAYWIAGGLFGLGMIYFLILRRKRSQN